jgi:hypothetical protein
VSKSTLSLGGSVQEACEAIDRHWTEHGQQMRAAHDTGAASASAVAAPAVAVSAETNQSPAAKISIAKLSIASTPDGADIEIDGAFVGNTPSEVELTAGEHVVSVNKAGYAAWQKKLMVNGGSAVRLNAALEKP